MITKATEDFPEIEWSRSDLEEVHNHEKHYLAIGFGADFTEYRGTWIEIDGEFEEITDIEESNF